MIRLFYDSNIALGSETSITISSDSPIKSANAINQLWKEIFNFEKQFSRFIPTSELCFLNKNSGTKQIISKEFRDILINAKNISLKTEGLYNPFILPALQRSGYTKSFVVGAENDIHEDYSDRSVVSVDKMEIGGDWVRIPFKTAIDLGGIGKGYLADKLAVSLKDEFNGFVINLGGDIVTHGTNDQNNNWQIIIQDASSIEDKSIGTIKMPLSTYSVSSSGTFKKNGVNKGKAWHHLINPKTLEPAKSDIKLITIMSKLALNSDTLASCGLILGSKDCIKFLKSHEIKNALIQSNTPSKKPILVGDKILLENNL